MVQRKAIIKFKFLVIAKEMFTMALWENIDQGGIMFSTSWEDFFNPKILPKKALFITVTGNFFL